MGLIVSWALFLSAGVMFGGTLAATDYGHAGDGWYAIPLGIIFLTGAVIVAVRS